jgi:hypothetical protein
MISIFIFDFKVSADYHYLPKSVEYRIMGMNWDHKPKCQMIN